MYRVPSNCSTALVTSAKKLFRVAHELLALGGTIIRVVLSKITCQ